MQNRKQRKQRVRVNSLYGLRQNILFGVPQGSILGPLGAKCITNWDRYYILGQLLQIWA